MCIEQHEDHRLALPAAKQKEEEDSELFMGARCFGAVPFKLSLKLEMPLKCLCAKNIPKTDSRIMFYSSTSKNKLFGA